MILRKTIIFLSGQIVFLFLIAAGISHSTSVEELERTVILLNRHPQDFEMKGEERKLITRFGTGLIIRYRRRDYLVTAKHVAEFLSKDGEMVMNLPGGKTTSLIIGRMETSGEIPGARWFFHPSADIAVHPIGSLPKIDHDYFPLDEIAAKNDSLPSASSAYVLGFPTGPGVQNRLSPLAQRVQIATTTTVLDTEFMRQTLRFILLDRALPQGFSGAPVFYVENIMAPDKKGSHQIKIGEKIRLAGILSAALSDRGGGKISSFVPIRYLWEILESADFLEFLNMKRKK